MKYLRGRGKILFLLILTVSMFTACDGGSETAGTETGTETQPDTAGYKVTYTAGSVSFKMVYVPGGITFPTGIDDSGSATVADAYLTGETEVTYELWYAVRDWAVSTASPAYTFANAGREGNNGTISDPPTADKQEPVTYINWRDAMVWMNALTEYYNAQNGTSLTPVYTYSSAIIRDSQDTNATACDGAVVSPTADGFRLLSSDEWELAARYIDDANSDGDIQDANEYYPGKYASGADAQYDATIGGSDIDGDGDVEYTTDVAVYNDNSGSSTALVKSKSSNALGLYDMSGNVWEWVFDLDVSNRVRRGGSWSIGSNYLQVGYSSNYDPANKFVNIGFRFARTQ